MQGVIISLKDGEGVIKSEEHGELPFDIKENFSDVDFTDEDINEQVEFTILKVRIPPNVAREAGLICLLLFVCFSFCVGLCKFIPERLFISNIDQLRSGNRAVRMQRVKEPLLLTLCTANKELDATTSISDEDSARKPKEKANVDLGPNVKLDMELYEGIVSQPIIEPMVRRL